MAFNVSRSSNTVDKEILLFPVGIDSVESVVLQASGAEELPSGVTGFEGQLGLRAGTILTKVDGDSQNRYKKYEAGGGEAVAGILGDNVYFADGTDASDHPADMLFHNCVFDTDAIVDWGTHESDVTAALTTCRFGRP